MLTLNHEDFEAFSSWVRRFTQEQDPSARPTLRNIVIPTPGEGIKLLLSIRELNELDSMLEDSDTELKSLEIIRLFEDI
jgi:hypothetical protein